MGMTIYILLGISFAFQAPGPETGREKQEPLTWKLDRKGTFLVKWKYEENTRYRDRRYNQFKRKLDQRSVTMIWSQPEKPIRGVFVVKVKRARWVFQDVKFRIVLDYVAGKPVKEASYVRKVVAPLHPELRNINMVRARHELALKVTAMKHLLEQKYVLGIHGNSHVVIYRTGTAVQQRAGGVPMSLFNTLFLSPSLVDRAIERGGRWSLGTIGDLPFGQIAGAVQPVIKVQSCSAKDILLDSSAGGRVGTKQFKFSMRLRYAKDGYVKSSSAVIRNGEMRKTMTLTMKRI